MMPLADGITPSPQQWAILFCVAGVGIMAYALRKRGGATPWTRILGREEIIDPRVSSLRDDLSRLIKELEDISGKLDRQLEQRQQSVQDAIADADQRIKALRLLVHAACQKTEPLSGDTPDQRTRRIYEMADQGMTATEIAHKLEEPMGEVDLILNLRTTVREHGPG